MLGMRCMVEDKPAYRVDLDRRIKEIIKRMEASPSLSAESYPDECWSFCNLTALSAIRVSDYLDGTDHGELIRRWLGLPSQRADDLSAGGIEHLVCLASPGFA